MSNQPISGSNSSSSSSSSQPVNEIEQTVHFDDLENTVTIKVDLRPGPNRLVVRVREEFLFSV
jgi:hypothetical protein